MRNKPSNRSVLIFGGAGFVGSNWAARLLKKTDVSIHVFDNLSRTGVRHNVEWLQQISENSGRLKITVGDIRNSEEVERAVRAASEIYNFAAQVAVTTSILDPRHDFEVNLCGTFNILDAARKSSHRPFLLFTSTNKVYGNLGLTPKLVTRTRYGSTGEGVNESQPLDFHSPYGCSKGAADQYVRDFARIYDIPTVVFRMSCIAGPRQFGNEDQGWVAHFLLSALQGKPITIYGDGRQVRDVLDVEDLLHAFEAARLHQQNTEGQIYNIGGGQANAITLLELIDEIEVLTGRRLEYELAERRLGDQFIYVTDFSKLRRDTGWQPEVSARHAVEHIYQWWKANRDLFPEEVESSVAATALGALQQLPRTA